MSGYTRLFSSILASSIWSEPDAVRIVWITMLAMADKHGMVVASIVGLAHQSRKTVKETEEAVAVLSGPDRYSKNPANDGRRIEAVPSVGWNILNYEEYRNGMDNDPEAAANRERQRRHREKLKEESVALHNVTSRDPVVGAGVGAVSGIQEGVQGEKPPAPTAPPKVEIPAVLLSQAGFTEAWDAWLIHRKAKKNPATDRTKATVLRRLAERPTEAVEGLDTCIVAGWVDVRWDWVDNRNKQEITLPTEANPIRWVGGEKMWVIKDADLEDWGRRYAGVDVDAVLIRLNDWLHQNPNAQKCKSFRGMIEKSLKAEQDKGGR